MLCTKPDFVELEEGQIEEDTHNYIMSVGKKAINIASVVFATSAILGRCVEARWMTGRRLRGPRVDSRVSVRSKKLTVVEYSSTPPVSELETTLHMLM